MFHPTNRDSHMEIYGYINTENHKSIYSKCPLYVGMPPICLDGPIFLDTPCMLGCPPYVWLPHVCLNGAKCMGACKGMWDIQTCGGCQNIQGHPTYGGIQKYGVHICNGVDIFINKIC